MGYTCRENGLVVLVLIRVLMGQIQQIQAWSVRRSELADGEVCCRRLPCVFLFSVPWG